MQTKTCIRLAGNGLFDFLNIDRDAFDLRDMASALSKICRFTGHTPSLYTVAHHSLLVAELVEAPHKLEALLHDAHEAYVGDVSTPLKQAIGDVALAFGCEFNPYVWIERQVETALRLQCGLPESLSPAVKAADRLAYEIERDVFWRGEFHPALAELRHIPTRIAGREWFAAVDGLLQQKGIAL